MFTLPSLLVPPDPTRSQKEKNSGDEFLRVSTSGHEKGAEGQRVNFGRGNDGPDTESCYHNCFNLMGIQTRE